MVEVEGLGLTDAHGGELRVDGIYQVDALILDYDARHFEHYAPPALDPLVAYPLQFRRGRIGAPALRQLSTFQSLYASVVEACRDERVRGEEARRERHRAGGHRDGLLGRRGARQHGRERDGRLRHGAGSRRTARGHRRGGGVAAVARDGLGERAAHRGFGRAASVEPHSSSAKYTLGGCTIVCAIKNETRGGKPHAKGSQVR